MKSLLSAAMLLLLVACTTQPPAPVVDRSATPPPTAAAIERPGYYVVKKGETLYSISLDHGQNYRDIAAWNNLDQHYSIKPGQVLRVAPENAVAVVKPIQSSDPVEIRPTPVAPAAPVPSQLKSEPQGGKIAYSDAAWAAEYQRATKPVATYAPSPATTAPATTAPASAPASTPPPATASKPAEPSPPAPAPVAAAPQEAASDWVWPTSGTVGTSFAESNKGIDIPAKPGQAVVAANSGTVTLVSNALRGYGNLLVIKHSQILLSVYAHNSKILVSEGQSVSRGQKVAEAGSTDSDTPKLHFEIRSMGKPVDPLKYLPPR